MPDDNRTVEILVFIILVVFTSAIVLGLIHFEIIKVRPSDGEEPSILNAEFIPFERDGNLLVKKFEFCETVTSTYECLNPKTTFQKGQPTSFKVIMESDTIDNQIKLEENYRIKGPQDQVYLEVGDRESFHYEKQSINPSEIVALADSFTVSTDLPSGTYTIEVFVTNPLINKKTTLTRTFEME